MIGTQIALALTVSEWLCAFLYHKHRIVKPLEGALRNHNEEQIIHDFSNRGRHAQVGCGSYPWFVSITLLFFFCERHLGYSIALWDTRTAPQRPLHC